MDEAFLLRAAMKGDLDAYNRLVLSYQDEIYSLVYYLHPDDRSIGEMVQRIFLLAFQKLHIMNGKGFRNWLLHCAILTCRAQWKRREKISRESLNPPRGEGLKTDEQWLRVCLASLPPDLRMALALVDMEGLEYPQAAEALGIPVQKLSQQLATARLQISYQMERRGLQGEKCNDEI